MDWTETPATWLEIHRRNYAYHARNGRGLARLNAEIELERIDRERGRREARAAYAAIAAEEGRDATG